MTFEQAQELVAPARRAQLARAVLGRGPWPDALADAERDFAFGLSLYLEYGDEAAVLAYCPEIGK